ncbi:site-specific integrase [Halomonas sp. 25-S5]|uniref:site-specific integrase n=1 Tax=Halomonas sp. 25-S5 TaxID=2994065 RepID=UPI0032AFF479
MHSLRHAYATHVLEQGLPVHQLQRLLGHRSIQSTMRYTTTTSCSPCRTASTAGSSFTPR